MKEIFTNKKKLLSFIAVLLMMVCGQQAMAQAQNVTGQVIDMNGLPLPGVTVSIKGTTKAIATDANGKFQIQVAPGENTLSVMMMGFTTKTLIVKGGQDVKIALEGTMSDLKEVVVVGYGSITKKEITGAVSVIKGSQVNNMPVSSVADILQGKAAGVTVSQSSGSPGSASVVHIRGIGSINGSTDPLYIVDGLPQTDINYLNPNDIESIAIHKDASVAAIYGSRASNGVIIVTTRSGAKNEKVVISYDGYYGFQSPWKRPQMLNAQQFIAYKNLAATNAGAVKQFDFSTQTNIDSVLRFVGANTGPNGTDWWNEITRYNAPVQSHNISVSGGGKDVSFLSSLAYLNQKGIIAGSDYERVSWRNNVNAQVSKRVKLSTNLGLIYEGRRTVDENNPFTGTIFSAMTADPITPVYRNNLQGLPSFLNIINSGYEPTNPFSQYSGLLYSNKRNPVAQIERLRQSNFENLSIKGGITADIQILKTLSFQSRGGMDLQRALSKGFSPQYYLNAFDNANTNTVSNYSYTTNYFVTENTLNYDQTWGKYHLTTLGGVSAEATNVSQFGASIQGFVNNDVDMRVLSAGTINPQVSGYPYGNSIASYFGRIGFDYNGKYIVAGNIRRDGSSRFADGYRWGTFPSASAAWRFTEENYFKDKQSNWLSDGKLRVSYGLIGNQNIGGGAYLSTYGSSIYDRYEFGNENTPFIGAGRQSTGNTVLKWETSKQLDIGLDLSFFNGRLNLAADYFDKKIDNMLLIVPLPTTLGYPTSPYSNAGNMQNKGWEFELAYNNNIGAFKYSVNGNISAYRNKVTKLGNGEPIFATAHLGEVFTKTEVGMPVGYYYGYVTNGIFQNAKQVEDGPQRETASPGDIRFKDINGDDVIDAKDRTMIGNPWPDFVYGLTMNASYKGFDLSVFFQGSQGNDVMNIQRYDTESGTGYYNATKGFLEKSWSGEGSTDKYHKISQKQGLNNSVSDYFVEDGSYLRVKNVQLGYNFANTFLQKLKMKQFRVYVGAQNLFTVTGYSGLDPEIGSADPKLTGIDQGYYPQARTFMIGINAKF
ncbi:MULTISPECIES: TonB-dependent receptor [unclassified Mucilaginibacter]|uniref:SusC/RagA family TonB-linked outer membrane protein n=1 Tax=unclassified Mucilaginibacter TaxID=2617802 RepID=UPI002AC9517E|nr:MULTISPECIES: TonB-dependent receptor [unclassified Mucilaginibacter]MEB0263274.1 TonB-dependent receptor [Mucilaginibacter sp. 10I4]MEB0278238.1 TonB-dependent receptor [Mucilaginibacter sp. 10B2]MEB0300976.1 TonB-dependent receptor [Mucilaginibacter sp. 5C4]WPX23883.1 TonB-dependent receptor [Mucilaginibacter sp. 5C4]